ncbi:unnamed protein product [Pleuronectes platessa]|uniref:Uncharacterized protein n=1 Tax=Pleuronectes platessa TaxID=8262 RepID=A0A9N7VT49_PLEPL|nr:unnamed protein product [Pleuronectes platessa]
MDALPNKSSSHTHCCPEEKPASSATVHAGSLARFTGPVHWPGSLARFTGPVHWPGSLAHLNQTEPPSILEATGGGKVQDLYRSQPQGALRSVLRSVVSRADEAFREASYISRDLYVAL